jgi:hypothetical protein
MVLRVMPRAAIAAICAVLVLLGPADARRRKSGPQLMQVLSPAGRATVTAHPDVNIVVRLTGNAVQDSFRARLNGRDVTGRFHPIVEQDETVGLRAVIPNEMVRVGRRSANRLRALVKGPNPGKGRPPRQVVRVRFRAIDGPNMPPVANIVPESEVLLPEVEVGFDASKSFDPELDELTYQWDLGDGVAASGITASRAFPDADQPRTVTLTVSDGQASSSAQITLRSCPQPEGTTPGTMQVEADGPLEFGAVAPGTTAARTFEIVNRVTDASSRLVVCLGVEGAGFTADSDQVEIGPGERATVTVTFAPSAEGHASAAIVLVGAGGEPVPGEVSRKLVTLLARGYGGAAPGAGPLPVSSAAFYRPLRVDELRGVFPTGASFSLAPATSWCTATDGGISSGDLCIGNGDCAANGGVCPADNLCRQGDRAGQVCASPYDCPIPQAGADPLCEPITRYDCPTSSLDVTEMCGDGAGGLFVLNEDSFTDPQGDDKDYPDSNTVLRLGFDANGNTTTRTILARIPEDSTRLACDRFGADSGGRVYFARTASFPESDVCFRDTKEELFALRKNGNGGQVLVPRIDALEGVSDCDDVDPVTHLEVSGDGSQTFASFESGGIWRLRPSPLQFIDSSFFDELFRLHPDGSIVFVTVHDGATKATVSVFKVMPSQVAAGPLPTDGLPPCATFQVPNNRKGSNRTYVRGLALSPSSPGSRDATILVSITAPTLVDDQQECAATRRRVEQLDIRGTIAFSSPADSTTCAPLGWVNLESMEQLTF